MTVPNRWEQHGSETDPWSAMSSVISGVLLWGLIGWGISVWLDAKAWIGAGLVIGGVLGVWVVYLRYGKDQSGPPATVGPVVLPGTTRVSATADGTAVPVTLTTKAATPTPSTADPVEEDTL